MRCWLEQLVAWVTEAAHCSDDAMGSSAHCLVSQDAGKAMQRPSPGFSSPVAASP
jgi:hypothetical protein